MSKNKYYAYFLELENVKGIVNNWNDCFNIVNGKRALYKSFNNEEDAQKWLDNNCNYKKNLEKGIYFDAGTGRKQGVEVKVTDEKGNNLLGEYIKEGLNEFGNYLLKNVTNNYGELMGMYIAINIALKKNVMKIFGDSKLVIDYWSKGFIKRNRLPEKTVKLADMVKNLREKFEKKGGVIQYISGDINPADLGFHR
jgi:ribonuclease HI